MSKPAENSSPSVADLTREYLQKYGRLFICLSGLSSSGKSYHLRTLAKLMNISPVDQDYFFHDTNKIPLVKLSDGSIYRNWDCKEALDLDAMNLEIEKLAPQGLLFCGFACRNSWMTLPIDFQIHLEISEVTCLARRQQRRIDPHVYSVMVVKELVMPFYQETRKQSQCDVVIDTNQLSERTLQILIEHIKTFLTQKLT